MTGALARIPVSSLEEQGADVHAALCSIDWDRDQDFLSEWEALVSACSTSEPFYLPEWFKAFSRAFVPHHSPLILALRSRHGLVGAAPLIRTGRFFGRVPARTLKGLSGLHSCRYDLVCDEANRDLVVREMWKALRADSWWDVIECQDVPIDGAFPGVLRHAADDGFLIGKWPTRQSPYMTVVGPQGDPFSECPREFKSFRKRLPNKLGKLEREHGKVELEVTTSGVQDAFRRFLRLEASGWKGKNGSAVTSSPQTLRFYGAWVEGLQRRGSIRIYSLRVGARVIAMHLGVVMKGVYYAPKVAYDESFSVFSPGQILNHFVIRDLSQNGFHTYEFLGPRAWWKSVWTLRVREHQHCYIFRPTLRGRLLHTMTMHVGLSLRGLRHKIWGDPQTISFGKKREA